MPPDVKTAFCCAKLKIASSRPSPVQPLGNSLAISSTILKLAVDGIGKTDFPARKAHKHFLLAEAPIAIEVDVAESAIGQRFHHAVLPSYEMVPRPRDRHVALAVGLLLGAYFFAHPQESAIIRGYFVRAGQPLQQRLVVKQAQADKCEGDGHEFLDFVNERTPHSVFECEKEGGFPPNPFPHCKGSAGSRRKKGKEVTGKKAVIKLASTIPA